MRNFLFKILYPVLKLIGKIHMPFSHKLITGENYLTLKRMVKPGGIFLTRTRGELTNVLIPGFWKHAALVIDSEYVIEAIGKGVTVKTLAAFLLSKDFVVYLEPKFTDKNGMESAAKKALAWLDLPYDYEFSEGDSAFYCGELAIDAYAQTSDRGPESFHGLKLIGETFYCPDRIYDSVDLWARVWDNLP